MKDLTTDKSERIKSFHNGVDNVTELVLHAVMTGTLPTSSDDSTTSLLSD